MYLKCHRTVAAIWLQWLGRDFEEGVPEENDFFIRIVDNAVEDEDFNIMFRIVQSKFPILSEDQWLMITALQIQDFRLGIKERDVLLCQMPAVQRFISNIRH
jgi:hypothetical protein